MATTPALKDRAARRAGIAFVVLLIVSVTLMAFSSNPAIRDAQNGIGFAFRPIQSALDTFAAGIASIGTAISEIDQLRVDNEAWRGEIPLIEEHFAGIGERLPTELRDELRELEKRLAN